MQHLIVGGTDGRVKALERGGETEEDGVKTDALAPLGRADGYILGSPPGFAGWVWVCQRGEQQSSAPCGPAARAKRSKGRAGHPTASGALVVPGVAAKASAKTRASAPLEFRAHRLAVVEHLQQAASSDTAAQPLSMEFNTSFFGLPRAPAVPSTPDCSPQFFHGPWLVAWSENSRAHAAPPALVSSRPDWARVPGVANRTQSRSRLGKTCSCHSARLEDPVKKPEPAIRKARSSRRSKPWLMVCGETWRNPVGLRPLAKPSAVAVAVGPRRQARLNWRCWLCRCRGPGWGESRTARSQARLVWLKWPRDPTARRISPHSTQCCRLLLEEPLMPRAPYAAFKLVVPNPQPFGLSGDRRRSERSTYRAAPLPGWLGLGAVHDRDGMMRSCDDKLTWRRVGLRGSAPSCSSRAAEQRAAAHGKTPGRDAHALAACMKPRPARRCPRRITPRDAQMQTRGPSGEHFAGFEARRSSIPDLCSEMDNRRWQRGRQLSLRLTQTRRAFTDSHHGRAEGVSLVWTECDSSKEGGESIMKRTTESLRVENLPVREGRHRGVGKCQPHIFFHHHPNSAQSEGHMTSASTNLSCAAGSKLATPWSRPLSSIIGDLAADGVSSSTSSARWRDRGRFRAV
ncbi:hypothetical protein L1887_57292 [Cichorium endivia]|nr:hypothetical protein L1887_57292 [Cichorium endivia]